MGNFPAVATFLFVCFYVPMLPRFIVTAIFLFYTEIVVKLKGDVKKL